MPGSGHRSMANRALAARLEQKDTGRLRVGRGASEIHVCVWDGEVVAAVSSDDLRHVLRRLLIAGEMAPERLQELLAMEEMGVPALGLLLDEADETVMQGILEDRFVENLTRYLGSAAKPRFSHQPVIYADNFQLGHDTPTLLQTCADAWDDAMSVDLDMVVFPGSAPPRTTLQRVIMDRLGGGATISRVLVQLPAEPFSARATIARMLRTRMLDTAQGPEQDTNHPSADAPPGAAAIRGSVSDLGETYVPDERTPIEVRRVLPVSSPPDLDDDDDPPTEGREVPSFDDDLAADPPTEEEERSSPVGRKPGPPAQDPAPRRAPGEAAPRRSQGAGDLSSFDAWKSAIAPEAEEELEAFSDFDHERGASGDGAFRTEDHNLDRIEVAQLSQDDALELDAAPSNKFGAPMLSEGEARAKLDVANSVLREVVAALDAAEGAGRGQAALQILLDGSPSAFQALFTNTSANDEGELPTGLILRNLNHRPPTEHRRLLIEGLKNLLERALSLAMEELPDEAIDAVLENVAGYSQRLGT